MEQWSILVLGAFVMLGVLARLPWRRARVIRVESRIARGEVVFDRPPAPPTADKLPTLPTPPRLPARRAAHPTQPKRKTRRR